MFNLCVKRTNSRGGDKIYSLNGEAYGLKAYNDLYNPWLIRKAGCARLLHTR